MATASPSPSSFGGSTMFEADDASWKERLTPANVGILAVGVVMLLVMLSATGSPKRATATTALPAAPSGVEELNLPMKRQPVGGIPSASAAASISVERGGKAPKEATAIPMKGIPSAASADSMSPNTKLPLKRSDGLPRSGDQRDAHAVDAHFGKGGNSSTLGMERQPATPVVTPGQAAEYADQQSNIVAAGGGANEDYPVPADANVPF